MKQLLIVGLGGFFGTMARYLVSRINLLENFLSLPLGTLTVNVSGSFLIGILTGLASKSELLSADMRLFLMAGFCGGFTTFSSFTNENLQLIQNGQFLSAAVYTVISLLLGFLAVFLGYAVTNFL
ncbi:MAG TPA: fluoride efflux transporter CrcB [Paludibacteraceae bacterium]|jgi:CrcB protein|nr:fluoride efflux transporter CrcB [Paludibacteraceae bacterium]OPZ03244.1 MAG: putative fluoride ion transporter CrcB [Bacteroidetes bacterium ADurb.BinA395]MBP8967252.1 fluoride efflux transporter CrcB [Paludibacteraceae bacterium]MBP9018125.1 fluoride efflux transporter CrcB [Paludibacteraceae bacterium]HOJ66782.1 fluoride efflux transporter CrcB [Paludibacteraceae bacterium]